MSTATRERLLRELEAVAIWVAITGAHLGCRDADDDKLLETALVGEANAIVTGDRDLLVLSPFRRVPVIEPSTSFWGYAIARIQLIDDDMNDAIDPTLVS